MLEVTMVPTEVVLELELANQSGMLREVPCMQTWYIYIFVYEPARTIKSISSPESQAYHQPFFTPKTHSKPNPSTRNVSPQSSTQQPPLNLPPRRLDDQ